MGVIILKKTSLFVFVVVLLTLAQLTCFAEPVTQLFLNCETGEMSEINTSTELKDIEVVKTGSTGKSLLLDLSEQSNINNKSAAVVTRGTASINGTIGGTDSYGPYNADSGDTIVVTLSWTPDDENIYVGFRFEDDVLVPMYEYTGGSCTIRKNITEDGDYSVVIKRNGSPNVTYSGFITYP